MNKPMRKAHKQLTKQAAVEDILRRGRVLSLGLCGDGEPYVVPICYGWEPGKLWLHTGHKGLKMDIIRANPRVSFAVWVDLDIAADAAPCKWEAYYRSVVGFGRAAIVDDEQERLHGLDVLTTHFAGAGDWSFPPDKARAAAIIRIDIDSMTGKRHAPDQPAA